MKNDHDNNGKTSILIKTCVSFGVYLLLHSQHYKQVMQLIQHKTKRMSELLHDWTSDQGSLAIQVESSHPHELHYSAQYGSELEAVMAKSLCKLLSGQGLRALVELDFRELDYFLRDKNTEPVFMKVELWTTHVGSVDTANISI